MFGWSMFPKPYTEKAPLSLGPRTTVAVGVAEVRVIGTGTDLWANQTQHRVCEVLGSVFDVFGDDFYFLNETYPKINLPSLSN